MYQHSAPEDKQWSKSGDTSLGSNAKLDRKIEKPSELALNPFENLFDPQFRPDIRALGKSHFQITFLFVRSKERRQALDDLYGFCRLVDDLADEITIDKNLRENGLEEIRNWVKEKPILGHPYWDRWRQEILRFQIQDSSLMGIIDGCLKDLNPSPYPTWESLESYMQGVASCVGEAYLAILGEYDERAIRYSFHMGRTLQYLNILRDLEADAELGRSYIPLEFNRSQPSEIRHELYRRAIEHRNAIRPHHFSYLSPEMMADIYFLGAKKYWIHGSKKRLNSIQKLWALIISLCRFFWKIA